MADIQRQINAPFKDGEIRDQTLLNQIDLTIDPVYQEFLALVAPDGYEVDGTGRGWGLLEKQPVKSVAKKERKTHTKDGCKASVKKVTLVVVTPECPKEDFTEDDVKALFEEEAI